MTATRRFYTRVSVGGVEGGYGVRLDERTLRTPGGAVFRVPSSALAEAVAEEWSAQGEHLVPASMPLSQLAFASIDVTPNRREEVSSALVKYIDADLVCHRAEGPERLIERQARHWDPIVAWAQERFHVRLQVVTGVIAAEVSPQLRTLFAWEVDDLDNFRHTALAQATVLSGSLLIGFALLEGCLSARQAFEAAALDNLWSLEHWGEDAEARAGLDRLERNLGEVGRFIEAISRSQ